MLKFQKLYIQLLIHIQYIRVKRVEKHFFAIYPGELHFFVMSSTGQAENKINTIKLNSDYIYFMSCSRFERSSHNAVHLVPSQNSEQSCMCVLGVSVLPPSTIFCWILELLRQCSIFFSFHAIIIGVLYFLYLKKYAISCLQTEGLNII